MNIDAILKTVKRLSLQLKSYGFSGNYATWQEAEKQCIGYGDVNIVNKVTEATLAVQSGKAAYERDSVLFYEKNYDWFIISCLLHIYSTSKSLKVVDFGGALGSIYFQHKPFLEPIDSLEWHIVEQASFVEAGKKNIIEPELYFHDTLISSFYGKKADLIMFRCVLPYVEHPYDILAEAMALQPEYILIDRNPFINGEDRICVQKVPASIVASSYPARFFNKQKLLSFMDQGYTPVFEVKDQEFVNINASYDGILFKRK